ncbi:carbon-nitrogen family hydrolase [Candidatus Pyrohabitans sp.]
MSSSKLSVAVAQLDIALGDKEANLAKVEATLRRTRAELVLFPELFTTGFDFPKLRELAEPLSGGTVRTLCELAGERLIAGTLLESNAGRLYNTFVLLSGGGIIAAYRKLHLFGEEKRYFSSGREAVVAEVMGTVFGLSTCYDLRFPELFRRLALMGSEMLLLSSEFPAQRQEHFDVLVRARAIENQCFMLACNRVGRDEHNTYAGGSAIISPWGEILARAGDEEVLLEAEIDPGDVHRVRRGLPVLEDIRRELFSWFEQG